MEDPTPPDQATRLEKLRGYLLAVASRTLTPAFKSQLAASDLVQQTFADALLSRKLPSESGGQLKAWLRRILGNNVKDAQRKVFAKKRDFRRSLKEQNSAALRKVEAPLADMPDAALCDTELRENIDAAINCLPQEYQQVLRWRHHEGQSFAWIASKLNLSPNAAQKLWSRAIAALKLKLATNK